MSCEEKNREAQQKVAEAIETIRGVGKVENCRITVYQSDTDATEYTLINYLLKKYGIESHVKTRAWIDEKLNYVLIKENDDQKYVYDVNYDWNPQTRAPASKKIFELLEQLFFTVEEEKNAEIAEI